MTRTSRHDREQDGLPPVAILILNWNGWPDTLECLEPGFPRWLLPAADNYTEIPKPEFFIPKLVAGLARAMRDRRARVELATLDFHCDWGSAEEYMDIAIDVAERAPGTDLIVATGRAIHARDLAKNLFAAAGLDYRDHIVERSGAPGQGPFQADLTGLNDAIGRVPVNTVFDVCRKILASNHESDLAPPGPAGR